MVVYGTSLNERLSAFEVLFKDIFLHDERLMLGTVNTEEIINIADKSRKPPSFYHVYFRLSKG